MKEKNIDKLSTKDRNDYFNKKLDKTTDLIYIHLIVLGFSILNISVMILGKLYNLKFNTIVSLPNVVMVLLFLGIAGSVWYIVSMLKLDKKYKGKIK